MKAIIKAANYLTSKTPTSSQVVFLTDAKSVLEAYESNKLPHLRNAMSTQNYSRIVMQWIPAHCKIPGNERADDLAKKGSKMEQVERPVTYQEAKGIIKEIAKPPRQEPDDYHLLNRAGQTIIFRLRTGHNRLNYHMYTKLKIGRTPLCACETAPQTSQHILQACPLLDSEREKCWPTQTSIERKLYGKLDELRRTVGFIVSSGIKVKSS